MTFSLSPGGAHDAPEGRKLLRRLGPLKESPRLLMDRAYEGDETRQVWRGEAAVDDIKPDGWRHS